MIKNNGFTVAENYIPLCGATYFISYYTNGTIVITCKGMIFSINRKKIVSYNDYKIPWHLLSQPRIYNYSLCDY